MNTMNKIANTCLFLLILGIIAGIGLIWFIACLIQLIWKI